MYFRVRDFHIIKKMFNVLHNISKNIQKNPCERLLKEFQYETVWGLYIYIHEKGD